MDKISVIVPVYCVEKYLSRCVDSILAQTYTDFELILVDDGSPDRCGEICEEYAQNDGRVHVLHQKNGGLSAARNAGIDWVSVNSNSTFLTFIDSDDWVHSQYLELLLYAAKTENVAVSIGQHQQAKRYEVDSINKQLQRTQISVMTAEDLLTNYVWNFNYAWGKLYKTECFDGIRYPEGILFEDTFTTYKTMFQYEKVALVHQQLYYYFTNDKGISHSPWSPAEMVVLKGMEEQISFYRENHYEKALNKEKELYINHHAYQICRVRESKLQEGEKRYYIKKLKRDMFRLIGEDHRKYGIRKMPQCYEAAYPKMMKLYHGLGSIVRKMKRQ